MAEYLYDIFEDVDNENDYLFYKLSIDGECQFERFYEEVTANAKSRDAKSMDRIIAYMDAFGPTLLPKEKFRNIKGLKDATGAKRSDVFEFKSNDLRVYVVLRKPSVYIVMGGYKKNQDKDVDVLADKIKEF